MEKAGVPLVPGYHGDDQDPVFLQLQADRIGYPVLLKPSAGGGGKGMRVVDSALDFKSSLISCKREAAAAFGDDKVLIEKYLSRPRHIEIQIFADSHGNCVYLFERDCSVQRRHQKVLEEAPAPGMSTQRRSEMGRAAIACAQAVGYVGAGTVEFIADQDGTFYFMEMNTRLQVEHPVTEMITGIDLVEWQLRVAFGAALPLPQAALAMRGHAIEARIYAENPDTGFLPSIGVVRYLRTPDADEFGIQAASSPNPARIDSGVRQGDAISPFYDPMIAKLIVWGEDRNKALARMRQALSQYHVVGIATNIAFLQRLVESTAFSTADLDTGLIERNRDSLFPPPQDASHATLAFAVAALIESEQGQGLAPANGRQADPWSKASGWRMHGRLQRQLEFADGHARYRLAVSYFPDQWSIHFDAAVLDLRLTERKGHGFDIDLSDVPLQGSVMRDGDAFHVFHDGTHSVLVFRDPMRHDGSHQVEAGRLTAPMPGRVVSVLVRKGQTVKKNDPLLVMEAMKMEHTVAAPRDGVVDDILYSVGEQVVEGAALLNFRRD